MSVHTTFYFSFVQIWTFQTNERLDCVCLWLDFYNVNENESGTVLSDGAPQGEREEYGKLVFTQLGKETLFFPVEVFSAKVKRHREYNLHQKCCLTGCNPVDFTVVCWQFHLDSPLPTCWSCVVIWYS